MEALRATRVCLVLVVSVCVVSGSPVPNDASSVVAVKDETAVTSVGQTVAPPTAEPDSPAGNKPNESSGNTRDHNNPSSIKSSFNEDYSLLHDQIIEPYNQNNAQYEENFVKQVNDEFETIVSGLDSGMIENTNESDAKNLGHLINLLEEIKRRIDLFKRDVATILGPLQMNGHLRPHLWHVHRTAINAGSLPPSFEHHTPEKPGVVDVNVPDKPAATEGKVPAKPIAAVGDKPKPVDTKPDSSKKDKKPEDTAKPETQPKENPEDPTKTEAKPEPAKSEVRSKRSPSRGFGGRFRGSSRPFRGFGGGNFLGGPFGYGNIGLYGGGPYGLLNDYGVYPDVYPYYGGFNNGWPTVLYGR